MIEKYFLLGARFKWLPPAGVPTVPVDGSIVDNPAMTAPTMTYDGIDGELFGATHPKTVGMSMRMTIPHQWLMYFSGLTTKMSLTSDTLTGPMSGCPIVTWTEAGVRYVGHCGTDETKVDLNRKVKKSMKDVLSPDATGFFPAAAWPYDDQVELVNKFKSKPIAKVLALVTAAGTFHSICMLRLRWDADDWCVGGIRTVPPLDRNQLNARLA